MNLHIVSGSRSEFNFSERLFNGFCFVTLMVIFAYIFISFNIGGFQNAFVNIIAFCCVSVLYYLSRFLRKTKIASPIFAFFLLTFLSIRFFQTDGLQGVIPLAFVIVYLQILFVVESKKHIYYVFFVFILVGILSYLNFNNPELFGGYPSEMAKKKAIMIMTFMTLSITTVLAGIFVRSYEEEKQTVENQYQELMRVEKEIENQNAILATLNGELKHIAYRTSHDLVAPLKTIKGYNELLVELIEDEDTETAKMIINNVRSNLLNMEDLILNMASVVQSEEEEMKAKPIDFEEIIQEIISKLSALSRERRVVIQTNLLQKRVFIGNKSYIQQILEQLMINGIKFSDLKKENRFVKVEVKEQGDNLKITVSDNGLGIPKEAEGKIFDMFYRAHSIRTHGSGLGLYLVKKLITKLKGTIDFKSSNQGTSFFVTLKFPTINEENTLNSHS